MARRDAGMYSNIMYISQIGIMMITPILGGVVLGNYLSEKMGSRLPFFICLIIGIMSSFYELYRFSIKYVDKMQKRKGK